MKSMLFVLSSLLVLSAQNVLAGGGELDPSGPAGAPKGLVIRAGASGSQDVFTTDVSNVASDAEAAAVIQKSVNADQQVKNIIPLSELDKTSSAGAWCSWYNPYYSNYGYYGYSYYYNYGYSFSYVPYYNYYYGGFNYYYYRYY